MSPAPPKLKSVEFRREREASWSELEDLVDRIERKGIHTLSAEDLTALPMLYRGALSSLSVARAISLDLNLVAYLEALTARAYFCVYGRRRHLIEILSDFFLVALPQTMRKYRWHLLLAFGFFLLGAIAAWVMTLANPELFHSFVSPAMSQGRGPEASTETLLDVLYGRNVDAAEELSLFASFLFQNNARVGIMCFALGFAGGLPVFYLLFTNGLVLGAFGALYHSRGLSVDLWGWLLPHGVTELGAIFVCGAAGLIIGQAVIFPGRHSRLDTLRRRGAEAGTLVVGAVIMLFVAALIEGLFRQLVQDITVRYTVAASTCLIWGGYFTLVGRRRVA